MSLLRRFFGPLRNYTIVIVNELVIAGYNVSAMVTLIPAKAGMREIMNGSRLSPG